MKVVSMRIAFVITGLNLGGAEKMVAALADAMVDKGNQILIIYMTGSAMVLPTSPEVRVIGLGISSGRHLARGFLKMRSLLREFRPDVVHSHMVHANIMSRLVRIVTPIPRLVCTAHNTDEGGKLRMLAYRLTDRLADISTNVSDEAVLAFINNKAVARGRMQTVHNGISTSLFCFDAHARERVRTELGGHADTQVILAVGRLSEQKDYPNLMHAVAQINQARHKFIVWIAGDGPLRQDMQTMAEALGISRLVRFLGVRHDIPKLMSAADVFVLPSAWEGFGLVAAEAMACERVVVATDSGGVREVVGDAGYLVPVRNPQALADALMKAMDMSPSDKSRLGKIARQRVQTHYSLEQAVEKWANIYCST